MEQDSDKKVTLIADGHRFTVHKAKLIACSDYFRAMFSNNFVERDKDVINLEDLDSNSLHILVEYVESGSYSIPDDALPLLQAAAMLQFTKVQSACEEEVLRSLKCENCFEVYSITSTLGLLHIAKSARIICLWNFSKFVPTPQYLNLDIENLLDYLSDPSLSTRPNGEWGVWEAIIAWIEENELERATHLKDLIVRCLDFKRMTADDVANMLFYSLVSENDEVVQLLEEIKKQKVQKMSSTENTSSVYGKSNSTLKTKDGEPSRTENLNLKFLTRNPSVSPSVIGFRRLSSSFGKKLKNSDEEDDNVYCTASRLNADLVPVVYVFNQRTCKIAEEFPLTKLCNGPVQCSGYQVCSVGPSVYIIGGEFQYGHGNWNKQLLRYSTATKKWISEMPLLQPRRHHMVCVVGSVIYILGGFGRHRVVQDSVDAFDTEAGQWFSCPEMPHAVGQGAACAFKGKLMVFTHEMQLMTYHPSLERWSVVHLKSQGKLGYRSALSWKNHIYLIDNCSTKVYKYSPDVGPDVIEYGYFMSPPINTCVVDGKIYNFSHDDLDNHVIEVLDIDDEEECHVDHSVLSVGQPLPANGISDASKEKADFDDTVPRKAARRRVVASREIWKENEDGKHFFTQKCPADVTFSLGCFSLLKL